MNCLACSYPFKLYEKNKNCFNCDKYVNYEQTQCINDIPEGYYLKDKEKGIIDKCYKLCKTCSKNGIQIGSKFYMNCDTCLYKNNSKVTIEGNCPENENGIYVHGGACFVCGAKDHLAKNCPEKQAKEEAYKVQKPKKNKKNKKENKEKRENNEEKKENEDNEQNEEDEK